MKISSLAVRGLIGPAIIAVGLLTAGTAGAQGIIIDEGGVRIAPPTSDRGPPPRGHWDGGRNYGDQRGIGQRDARRIARGAGIVNTYGVDRHGPVWVVEGADRRGRGLRVTINARSGDIINVDRARRG